MRSITYIRSWCRPHGLSR